MAVGYVTIAILDPDWTPSTPVRKECRKCHQEKPTDQFDRSRQRPDGFYPYCKTCKSADSKRYGSNPEVARRNRERHQRWKKNNPERVRAHDRVRILSEYGLTVEQYDAMLVAQGGVCAICKRPETECGRGGRPRQLAVDHDHVTGKVRGLLCRKCNTILGLMDEDAVRIAAMVSYLNEHGGA